MCQYLVLIFSIWEYKRNNLYCPKEEIQVFNIHKGKTYKKINNIFYKTNRKYWAVTRSCDVEPSRTKEQKHTAVWRWSVYWSVFIISVQTWWIVFTPETDTASAKTGRDTVRIKAPGLLHNNRTPDIPAVTDQNMKPQFWFQRSKIRI